MQQGQQHQGLAQAQATRVEGTEQFNLAAESLKAERPTRPAAESRYGTDRDQTIEQKIEAVTESVGKLETAGKLLKACLSFGAGAIQPITALFESPKSLLIGIGASIAVTAALTVMPLATPLAWLAGAGITAYFAYKCREAYNAAETDEQRAQSFVYAGNAATSAFALCLGLVGKIGISTMAFVQAGAIKSFGKSDAPEANTEAVAPTKWNSWKEFFKSFKKSS